MGNSDGYGETFFCGIGIGFVLGLLFMKLCFGVANHEIKKAAIEKGHAVYEVNSDGVTEFKWKEYSIHEVPK